jgi:preprotein translocase subunit SecF
VTDTEEPSELDDEAILVQDEVQAQAATVRARKAGVGPFRRLYRGLTEFDFVGRSRVWFTISAVVIIAGMSALGIRGLNLGIDFKGGSTWTIEAPNASQTQVVNAVTASGLNQPVVEILTNTATGKRTVQVEADLNSLSSKAQTAISNRVTDTLARLAGAYDRGAVQHVKGSDTWTIVGQGVTEATLLSAMSADGATSPTASFTTHHQGHKLIHDIVVTADVHGLTAVQQATLSSSVKLTLAKLTSTYDTTAVSSTFVGPTWGGEITSKAIEALIAFFFAVVIYISLRFEPKMALAAFIAMLHDLAVTVGIYALFGFQVTPDTVIAVLTILGYSLYDTVVVFDRVRDNTKPFAASGRMTYSTMVNLSMNQTLARSINTSMVAILPVFSVLLIGAELLGAVTLQAYGVALTVGLLSGAYSSIFIASPLLAIMKEREQKYRAVRQRLTAKGERLVSMSAQGAARFAMAAPAASTGATGRLPSSTPRPPTSDRLAPTKGTRATPSVPGPQVPSTQTQQSTPAIQPRARKQKKR